MSETIRILSRVACVFRDHHGNNIFTIPSNKRFVLLDAPAAIQKDPLFNLLLNDGSIECVTNTETQRTLENDPVAGTNAEGKKLTEEVIAARTEAETEEIATGVMAETAPLTEPATKAKKK